MGLIFVLSSQSGLKVSQDPAVDRPFRVTGHLLAYAGLGGLLLYALCRGGRPRPRDALVALLLAVLYGVSDELHQSFVPDRTGRLADVAIDAAGATVGLAVAWILLALRARVTRGAAPRR